MEDFLNASVEDDRFITSTQLRARYGGRSHMWVERRLRDDPTFPRPIYLGRLRFWKIPDLEIWERVKAANAVHGEDA